MPDLFERVHGDGSGGPFGELLLPTWACICCASVAASARVKREKMNAPRRTCGPCFCPHGFVDPAFRAGDHYGLKWLDVGIAQALALPLLLLVGPWCGWCSS